MGTKVQMVFQISIRNLKNTQFKSSLGRTVVERWEIVGKSYDNSSREHDQVMIPQGSVIV